jgi:thioesterase domain-containing protein/acyl carrier protein
VTVSWARSDREGRYDVELVRTDQDATTMSIGLNGSASNPQRTGSQYANQPLAKARSRELAPVLRAHLRERVPEYMMPSAFVVLNALPLTPNGKVDRRALPPPDGFRGGMGESFDPPGTETETRLARIWSDLLGVERVGLSDDFFELGGHSLMAVKLFARIEREFGRRLPLATLFQAGTLGRLAATIERETQPSDTALKALVVLQAAGTRPPLVLMHGAWGSVLRYRELAARLGSDQPVYGFEAPLGPDGAAKLQRLEPMVAEYIRELRTLQPEGPYFLSGYCWGGTPAFEMARQLRAAGHEVGLLAVIDSTSPGYRRETPVHLRLRARGRNYQGRIWRNLRRLGTLDPRKVPAFLGARVGNFVTELAGGVGFRLSLRAGRALLPGLRKRYGALFQAGKLYHPGKYAGRVTLFRAHPPGEQLADPAWGWDRLAAEVDVVLVDGDHRTMLIPPHVETLAARLRSHLERAQRESRPSPSHEVSR